MSSLQTDEQFTSVTLSRLCSKAISCVTSYCSSQRSISGVISNFALLLFSAGSPLLKWNEAPFCVFTTLVFCLLCPHNLGIIAVKETTFFRPHYLETRSHWASLSDEPRVNVRFTASWQHSQQPGINACFLWPLLWLIHFLRSGPCAVSAFKQVRADYFAELWTPATHEMSNHSTIQPLRVRQRHLFGGAFLYACKCCIR